MQISHNQKLITMNNNKLYHQDTRITFISEEGIFYEVAFTGKHTKLKAEIYRSGFKKKELFLASRHANKSTAHQLLTKYMKSINE